MSTLSIALITTMTLSLGVLLGAWIRHTPAKKVLLKERRRGEDARTQFERIQAANEERQRIYRDLHDDIGAKMLTLIHSLDNDAHADLARAVMQDLRDIVSRSAQAEGSLLDILAQIRDETEARLEILSVVLHWEQSAELPDPHLDDGQALHLFRIVREAVTNSLRHARPQRIRIRSRQIGEDLVLDVTDDGPGPRPEQTGAGTSAMRRRAEELHGSIHWDAGTEGGTKVLLRFPLPK